MNGAYTRGMSTSGKSAKNNSILIDRIYDARKGEGVPDGADCYLVDRLWPRGVAKDSVELDGWPKELTPSNELRKHFHEGGLDWPNFSKAYRKELDDRFGEGELDEALEALRKSLGSGDVVLLIAGKDTDHTHAKVLRDWLGENL